MKKHLIVCLSLFFLLGFVGTALADGGASGYVMGDEVYVCNCGPTCQCMTVSNMPGKCGCGNDLVKGVVTYSEGSWIAVRIDEGGDYWVQTINTAGKYACACGDGCACKTTSMKPGTCGCGMALEAVQ